MFTQALELFVSIKRLPIKAVVITALASYVLQIGAITMGQPLYIIALYTLLPWIPLMFFEGLWKYEHYNWVAIFGIVTLLQVGHIGEHTFQVTQLAFLNGTLACPPPVDDADNAQRAVDMGLRSADQKPTGLSSSLVVQAASKKDGLPKLTNGKEVLGPPACGVFGQLDFETVHLIWDTLVWVGALWLLTKFPGNLLLWLATFAASAHEIEHLFIGWIFFAEPALVFNYMRQLWATTANGNIVTAHPVGLQPELTNFYEAGGKVGILGQNGLIASLFGIQPINELLPFPIRPYLHFGYNSLVVIPTVLAFLWQVRRVYDEYLAKALPGLSEKQLIEATTKLENLKYEPGALIIRQGDPADKFYIITKGQVEVVRRQASGMEVTVTRLGNGQYFGEIGLLHGGRRTATVRAATPTELVALDRETFIDLMDDSGLSKQEVEQLVRQRVGQLKAIQESG